MLQVMHRTCQPPEAAREVQHELAVAEVEPCDATHQQWDVEGHHGVRGAPQPKHSGDLARHEAAGRPAFAASSSRVQAHA